MAYRTSGSNHESSEELGRQRARRKARQRKRRVKQTLVCFVALLIIGFFAWFVASGQLASLVAKPAEPTGEPTVEPVEPEKTDEPEKPTDEPTGPEGGSDVPEILPPEKTVTLEQRDGVTYLTIEGHEMLLVNKVYEIPSDYGDGVDSEAGAALERLYAAAGAAGYTLNTVSGYRSYDTQQAIFQRNVNSYGEDYANTFSARPGQSEHQTGLAFDVNGNDYSTSLSRSFRDTAEYAWLKENMADYGFIERYADGKSDLTGYVFEPWHIRYVGVELARIISASGLAVEEYAAMA